MSQALGLCYKGYEESETRSAPNWISSTESTNEDGIKWSRTPLNFTSTVQTIPNILSFQYK